MEKNKEKTKKKKVPECKKCGEVFSYRQNLWRHQLICVKEVEYTCVCGKSFLRRDNLFRHRSLNKKGESKCKYKENDKLECGTCKTVFTREFYESMWRLTHHPYRVLHEKYLALHSREAISYGTFIALKPFYVRTVKTRDIEICCCKVHLHARTSIQSLISLLSKYCKMPTEFNDYYSFFSFLTRTARKKSIHTFLGAAH